MKKGFFQKEHIDYHEKFASVVLFEVLLLVVGKCISEGWHIYYADIATVSLRCNIDCELFSAAMMWSTG